MHQYLFFIDGFPIRTYGLVLSLSIILATGVGYFLAKADRRGYEDHIVDLGIYCGVAGLIGARLWDVFFFDWDYYSHHLTELFNVWQGGMAIQGGVILGVLTGVWYCRHHHLDTVHLMDVLAPASYSDRRSDAVPISSTAMPLARQQAPHSASSTRIRHWHTMSTAVSPSGLLRSGKDSSISSSSHCCSCSARHTMPKDNASRSTSCSTVPPASASNSCAAIIRKRSSASSRVPRRRVLPLSPLP